MMVQESHVALKGESRERCDVSVLGAQHIVTDARCIRYTCAGI